MSKARRYSIPARSLDKAIADLALRDARRLTAGGLTIEQAALTTCTGDRTEYARAVAAKLRAERRAGDVPCCG